MQLKQNHKPINKLKTKRVSKYKISIENVGIVMNILRNQLYSNKILAVIREYLTNAADEHVENKVTKAIDITLPNGLCSDFIIRDHGRGLNHSNIESTYIILGQSTKRVSNTLTGCLGLGSKAGFAYSDSFTIISYNNGKKTTYLAFIDETNEGRLAQVSSEPTIESGMEIRIPVSEGDYSRFASLLAEFLSTFSCAVKVTPPIEVRKYPYNRELVVMGNVAYPYNSRECNIPPGNRLFLNVPIGSIDITASREGLEYTDKTKLAIRAAAETELDRIWNEVTKRVESKASWFEAVCYLSKEEKANQFPSKVDNEKHEDIARREFLYKGDKLTPHLLNESNAKVIRVYPFHNLTDKDTWEYKTELVDACDILLTKKPIFIYYTPNIHGLFGFHNSEEHAYLLDQVHGICKSKQLANITIFLCNKEEVIFAVPKKLIPAELILYIPSFPEEPKNNLTKVVKPRKPTAPTNTICFKFQSNWKRSKPISIDTTENKVYILRKSFERYRGQKTALELVQTLKKLIGDPDIYVVNQAIPEWTPFQAFLVDQLNKLGFSKEVLAYYYLGEYEYGKILEVASYKDASPQMKTMAIKQQGAIAKANKFLKLRNCSILEFSSLLKKTSPATESVCPIINKYPLLEHLSWWSGSTAFPAQVAVYAKLVDAATVE